MTRISRPTARLVAVAGGLVLVALVGAVLVATNADLPIALGSLLVVVIITSVGGYFPGVCAAVASSAVLTYYFTPPVHTFRIDRTDDLVALGVFVAAAGMAGAVVARLNELRRRADLGAQEVQFRLALINRLIAGNEPRVVLEGAAEELARLFDLASCVIVTADGERYEALTSRAGSEMVPVATGGIRFELEPIRALSENDRSMIEAFGASVATVLDRIRLDLEAREHRVRGEIDHSRAGFLTAVTHDLRTPLATVKASTGALLVPDSRLDPQARRQLLELAHDEATRLERLVTKVLETTRIRAGALRPEPVASSVGDLAQAAVGRLRRLTDHRSVVLDIDPEIPAVWVDPGMIEHVLVNLVENALRHGASEKPIEIRARAGVADVEVSIADHGPGIAAADRQRVFEEFVRLDTVESSGGMGLGLAIVSAFVSANDGRVWCDETPGGGATFTVVLPAASDEARS